MAEVMKVLVERIEIEKAGGVQEALSSFLPEYCSLYFKDGCEVSVDGKNEPDKLLDIARKWNKDIMAEVRNAIEKWKKLGFPLDSTVSFEARLATQAADGYFNPNGMNTRAVVDSTYGYPFFDTIIETEMMRQIETRPEDFVIAYAVYDF